MSKSTSVFTKENLKRIYDDTIKYNLQVKINALTNDLKLHVINENRKGKKNYTAEFTENSCDSNSTIQHLEKADIVLQEVEEKLKEIFIDSEIKLESNKPYYLLKIDWST
jgi:hydroxymethylpyrimidine pyrophosphatase-like HAD family hydrolase